MPLVHRILYALRTLTEDEPRHSRGRYDRNKPPNRGTTRRKQAVALVITFRDLFASGGLNILLEDMEANLLSDKDARSSSNKGIVIPEDAIHTSAKIHIQGKQTQLKVELPGEGDHVCSEITDRWRIDLDNTYSTVPLLNRSLCSSLDVSANVCPSLDLSPSKLLRRVPEGGELEVLEFGRRRWSKKRKDLTVSLTPDDENETVAILRKVLKWSPRKQDMAKFTVPLPREEEHKAVAVVQNAVNRVKEEQQKRKKKLKLFKFTFC